MTEREMLDVVSSILAVAEGDAGITPAMCVAHNTEPLTGTGKIIPSCYLTWGGTKLPYELGEFLPRPTCPLQGTASRPRTTLPCCLPAGALRPSPICD